MAYTCQWCGERPALGWVEVGPRGNDDIVVELLLCGPCKEAA
jgi:hypothetical protein